MTKTQKLEQADRIVRDLLNALDYIARESTEQKAGAIDRIRGASDFALKVAQSQMVRNRDGYLSVNADSFVN